MKFDRHSLALYAVTDRSWLRGRTLAEQVEDALRGGATCVQLREKELARAEFLREAFVIREICRAHNVPFIINDDVMLARECGADGVHVGQDDMEAGDVRGILGPDMIIGVSAHSVDEALLAQSRGADYLGVGAMFHTGTKLNVRDIGPETLRAVCAAVDIPVVGIGGITADNIAQLSGTGLDGVAVVSAIFAADDIEAAARDLLKRSLAAIRG